MAIAREDNTAPPFTSETRTAVTRALTRVLASDALRSSPRSRDFLAYVVTETLAGRGARLSERTVGRYALGRGAEFDGRFDASVRVQATRVRRSLDAYYATEGQGDEVRIALPVGSYAPTFSRLEPAGDVGSSEPGLVIVHLASVGSADAAVIAAALTDSLGHRLPTFPGIRVVGPVAPPYDDARRIGWDTQTRFVLQGRVLADSRTLRVSARLTDSMTGSVVWSVSETVDRDSFNGAELEDRWVGSVAGEVGDLTGVLARLPVPAGDARQNSEDFAARSAFHRYLELGNAESVLAAEAALRRALAHGQRPWLTVVCHASTLAVRVLYGVSEDRDADLAEAEALARESLIDAPDNSIAPCVLATVAIGRRQWEVARLHAAEAARRAPSHPTTLISAGSLLALAGDIPGGAAVLREALKLHPSHAGYLHAHLAVERLIAGDDAAALAEASLIQSPGFVWGPLYRAMALAALGHLDQARAELAEAVRIEPLVRDDPAGLFTRYTLLSDEQLAALMGHLQLMGQHDAPGPGDSPAPGLPPP